MTEALDIIYNIAKAKRFEPMQRMTNVLHLLCEPDAACSLLGKIGFYQDRAHTYYRGETVLYVTNDADSTILVEISSGVVTLHNAVTAVTDSWHCSGLTYNLDAEHQQALSNELIRLGYEQNPHSGIMVTAFFSPIIENEMRNKIVIGNTKGRIRCSCFAMLGKG